MSEPDEQLPLDQEGKLFAYPSPSDIVLQPRLEQQGKGPQFQIIEGRILVIPSESQDEARWVLDSNNQELGMFGKGQQVIVTLGGIRLDVEFI